MEKKTFKQLKFPILNHLLAFIDFSSYFRLTQVNIKFNTVIKENTNFNLMVSFYKYIKKLKDYSEFPNDEISTILIDNKNNQPLLKGFNDILVKENIHKIVITTPNENYERYQIIMSPPFEINCFCLYKDKDVGTIQNNSFMIKQDPVKFKMQKLCQFIHENNLDKKITTFEVFGYSSVTEYIIRYLSCFSNVSKYILRDIIVTKYQYLLNFKYYIDNYDNRIKTVELYNTKQTYTEHSPFFLDVPSIKFLHTNATQLDFILLCENSTSITELYINDNPNIDKSVVLKFLMIPTLKKLSIINCKLTNKDFMFEIETNAKKTIVLTHLDISFNLLSNEGIIQLSKIISDIKSLELVDISHNLYNLSTLNRGQLDKRIEIKE